MLSNTLNPIDKKGAKEKAQPKWIEPMLATLAHDYFSDPQWIYERKLDGVRCLIFKDDSGVKLISRNKKEMNSTYPELVKAFSGQKGNFIADGEIVTFDDGLTSFGKLQARMNVVKPSEGLIRKTAVYLYLFDIIHIGNFDITSLDLRSRKRILKAVIDFEDPVRYCSHKNEFGTKYLKEACAKGWEGLIAKDARSGYVNARSKKWLKFKCVNRQEFVIGGYTEPQGARVGFGALLIGFYDNGDLKYAGKVGTGYSDKLLKDLYKKMRSREKSKSPFAETIRNFGTVHWIKPELVAEIGFTEWTSIHKLRHPRFIGLRNDKKAGEVRRE